MLSSFFFFFLIAKEWDRTVLTDSCGPTPILGVHRINKKFNSLDLKNRFSQSDLPVRSGFENQERVSTPATNP